jgi:hypothetical protein
MVINLILAALLFVQPAAAQIIPIAFWNAGPSGDLQPECLYTYLWAGNATAPPPAPPSPPGGTWDSTENAWRSNMMADTSQCKAFCESKGTGYCSYSPYNYRQFLVPFDPAVTWCTWFGPNGYLLQYIGPGPGSWRDPMIAVSQCGPIGSPSSPGIHVR